MNQTILFIFFLCILAFISRTTYGSAFEPLQVMCEVNGHLIPAMIDTGAEITVMSASCAKKCRVSNLIDTQHAGKAVGVGFSDIVGGIDGVGLRIGPLNFQSRISILRNSRCDFLIGLDVLKRFKCDISLREKVLRFYLRGNEVRIPLLSNAGSPSYSTSHDDTAYDTRKPLQSPQSFLPSPSSCYSNPSTSFPATRSSSPTIPTESLQEVLELQGGYFEDEEEDDDFYDLPYDSTISMEGV